MLDYEALEPGHAATTAIRQAAADILPAFQADVRLTGMFDRVNLQSAIEGLPEGYKRMFLLHDLHGYEHNEIAQILDCSVGNSKSQVHKARKRLRESLRKVDRYKSRTQNLTRQRALAVAG